MRNKKQKDEPETIKSWRYIAATLLALLFVALISETPDNYIRYTIIAVVVIAFIALITNWKKHNLSFFSIGEKLCRKDKNIKQ